MSRKPKHINQYKLDNEAFLAAKAAEEGVVELSSGVLCRKIEEGRGTRCPKPSSIVYVHYTGRLIDGDRWEIYVPAKWAYGAVRMDAIPAHSTLVFDLELIKIERL